jgi:hypothetical protein
MWTRQQADKAVKNPVPVAKPTVEVSFVMEIGTEFFYIESNLGGQLMVPVQKAQLLLLAV